MEIDTHDYISYDYIFYTNVDAKRAIASFLDKLSIFWSDLIIEVTTDNSLFEYDPAFLDEMDTPLWGLHIFRDQVMLDESRISGGAITAQGDSMIQLLSGQHTIHKIGHKTVGNHDTRLWGETVFIFDQVRCITLVLATDESSVFTKAVTSMLTDCLLEKVSDELTP